MKINLFKRAQRASCFIHNHYFLKLRLTDQSSMRSKPNHCTWDNRVNALVEFAIDKCSTIDTTKARVKYAKKAYLEDVMDIVRRTCCTSWSTNAAAMR
jgi:hypothetical protein